MQKANKIAKVTGKNPILRDEVYQGNLLIQARKEFDTLGMRIYLLGLRGLNPHFSLKDKKYDQEFPEVFISTKVLTELFGGNTKYLHDLKAACKKMLDATIELNDADGGFKLMHIFRELYYKPKEGLYLQFDDKMRPYLLDLFETRGYTRVGVEQIFYLSSPYSIRLVEIMLQYQNIPKMKLKREIVRKVDVEQLRFMLNVPEGTYKGRINNFRQYVLDGPIAEINSKTIFRMSYTAIKKGGRVTGFEFHMDISALPEEERKFKYSEIAFEKLRELGFNNKAAAAILQKCENADDCLKRIDNAIEIFQQQSIRKPIENQLGFLRRAIEEKWKPATNLLNLLVRSRVKCFEHPKEEKPSAPKSEAPKELTREAVQIVWECLNSPSTKQYAPVVLKNFNLTVEEFEAKYQTKYQF